LVFRYVGRFFSLEGTCSRAGWLRRVLAAPDQHSTVFVNREALCLDNLGFEILKIFIVQVEPPLQRAI
jgi:hypothetical protein